MTDQPQTTPVSEDFDLAYEFGASGEFRNLLASVIAKARAEERERCVGIVTALWGADLVTTQAAMNGEITLDEAVQR